MITTIKKEWKKNFNVILNFKKIHDQWLRLLTGLVEEKGSVPTPTLAAHNCLKLCFRDLIVFFLATVRLWFYMVHI